jgi:hypothetical protein
VPPGVLQADFYIDGMNLHIPLLWDTTTY